MKVWLETQVTHIPPRNGVADAIRYARNELDTNTIERAIHPITLGRTNHLFADSDGGPARWATVCFLITTAKLNDVEPFAYHKDALDHMSGGRSMSESMNSCPGI